jgi:hypothetical protein
MSNVMDFEDSMMDEIKRIVDETGGGVFVEIYMGGERMPVYTLIATKTEITNNGNVIRIYAADGKVFETAIQNVVLQLLGKEREKVLQPK